MTIRARYAGKCRVCGKPIRPGDLIEWERGQQPAHASCVDSSAAEGKAKTKAEDKKVVVEIIDYGTLDQYGQLNFRYRTPDGQERFGQDVTPQGFKFYLGQYEVADAEKHLQEALKRKEQLLAERQELINSFRQRLLAGEKLLRIGRRSYDCVDYPVLDVGEEIADALPFNCYYELVAELFPWLGHSAYGTALRTELPAGTPLSIQDVQAIEREKYEAWRHDQEERERILAEIREVRASGGHVVALKRCWECGRTAITGEFDDNGKIVRMPKDVYEQAVRAQAEAHRRSLQAAEGVMLSSVGFDPDPSSKFRFRIVETYYCGC